MIYFNLTGDDNYDEDDTKLMPPPNWIPGQSTGDQNQAKNQSSPEKTGQESPDNQNLSPGSKAKLNTPLADMLPPELADKNVTELFPEFKPGQVSYPMLGVLLCVYCNKILKQNKH